MTRSESHPHLSKLDEQLELWNAKLDVVSAKAKIESRKHLDELKSKLVAARTKLDEAKAAGAEQWDSLKDTVADTWKDIEGAFAKLVH
jgi:hypothetical protein